MSQRQLTLSVQLRESASFDTFHAGPNAGALAAARHPPAAGAYFCGPSGGGKTHLLQAAARATARAAYLPLMDLAATGPGVLQGLEPAPLLCLDDVHAVCADDTWALTLLRLLDQRRGLGLPLLVSATEPPERLPGRADLHTRLTQCALFRLAPLDDASRAVMLTERAHARGLRLPPESMRWLLTHLPRDPQSLIAALDRLDRASLQAQRRLTLPFVQQVLGP